MYLPAEVCIVVSGQPSRAKLNSGQTKEMINHAVRKPWDNAASIVGQGIQTVGLDEKSNMLLVCPCSYCHPRYANFSSGLSASQSRQD
jgi:eukaryotic translation initiation factor 2C